MNTIKLSHGVQIDIVDGPIGVSCSGGADSALLLFLLMKHTQQDIHVFTCSSSEKGRKNALVVPLIIEKCIQLTNHLNVISHSWHVPQQNNDVLFDPQKKYLKMGLIKAVCTGFTANPSVEISNSFSGPATEQEARNPLVFRETWDERREFHKPFTNVDKQIIAVLYKSFELIETLFPLTRSCESLDLKNLNNHCGECWWCNERAWAFGNV